MEVVHLRDGDNVTLRPCPPWCTEDRHFADDEVVYADHGYHHYGTEIEVPTSCKFLGMTDGPETIVRAVLKSWTHRLDADPDPALIELNLGTAAERTDMCAEITPRRGPGHRPGAARPRGHSRTRRATAPARNRRRSLTSDYPRASPLPHSGLPGLAPRTGRRPAVAQRASDEELLAGALHARIERWLELEGIFTIPGFGDAELAGELDWEPGAGPVYLRRLDDGQVGRADITVTARPAAPGEAGAR